NSTGAPTRAANSSAPFNSRRATSLPTVPHPSSATRTGLSRRSLTTPPAPCGTPAPGRCRKAGHPTILASRHLQAEHVLVRLSPQQQSVISVTDRDHSGFRLLVVVARHRIAVRPCRRHGEQVPRSQGVRQPTIADDDVTGLTVLSHHPGQHRLHLTRLAVVTGPGDEPTVVSGVVQSGTEVVAHPPVRTHVPP